MKRFITWGASLCAVFTLGIGGALAQDEEADAPAVFPVDIWSCTYHEGKGHADLDGWVEKFNAYFGEATPDGYSAWRLTPYYFSAEQEFDFLWLGAAKTAVALGKGHEKYLANGELIADVLEISECDAHLNFAAMTYKQPPDSDSKTGILDFSDCSVSEGKTWGDLNPALNAWAEYLTEVGSKSGMWIMWPVYGGGDQDGYDFKWLSGYDNYVDWGEDYDRYGKEGWKKAMELFEDLVECDDARLYNVLELRDGITDEE
jgi:hypothetical protein